MEKNLYIPIEEAKKAALNVLLHNMYGPCRGLPRTAGWGYPEPYTRDWMISALGILASGNEKLIGMLKHILITLAKNQSEHGHMPSLIHDPEDRGASDTTPLFLFAVALFRQVTGETDFLEEAVQKAFVWMDYQSPDDRIIVAQLPTSDWRDEQWILGYGLFVNTLYYSVLRLYGYEAKASCLKDLIGRFVVRGDHQHRHVHEGLVMPRKPYYAMWSYKVNRSERFDLLGNCLAILFGIASPTRSKSLIHWIEKECDGLREQGELSGDLPPCFFPYIRFDDPDWLPRYEKYNRPGEYHNGGIWPFICAFYVVAILITGQKKLAEAKLVSLTNTIQHSRDRHLNFGFNEWLKAQDGSPQGQDWQTWSAAMYLYASKCVEKNKPLFIE